MSLADIIQIIIGVLSLVATIAVSFLIYCDIVNIGLHFILKNVRPYAAPCSEA